MMNGNVQIRSLLAHLGLVLCSILYICMGAFVFHRIERPNEIAQIQFIRTRYATLKMEFIAKCALENLTRFDIGYLLDEYIGSMFEFFGDPQAAVVFEADFMDYATDLDQWTPATSFLFATTIVIPVGYGFVTPTTKIGRLLIILYGIIGAPLILIAVSDVGKFISYYSTKLLPNVSAFLFRLRNF
ncbi:unnamed protein product [Anisakis simplex]|uniref:Ion_trans_2 domain-containing protein n=2 Tax=Anisakis simplex TaxID=6269 RepID=A0A0M3KEY1_ANISI|nr:unnamed protein product [Anisakis simplex]